MTILINRTAILEIFQCFHTHLDVIFKNAGRSHCWYYIVNYQLAVTSQEVTLLMQLLDSRFILGHILLEGKHIVLHKVVQDQVLIHTRLVLQASNVFDLTATQLVRKDDQQIADGLVGLQKLYLKFFLQIK